MELTGNEKYNILNQKILSSFSDEMILCDVVDHSLRALSEEFDLDGVERIIMYGSYANKNQHIDSDIDIALIGRESYFKESINYALSGISADIMDEFNQVIVHFLFYDSIENTSDIERNIFSKDWVELWKRSLALPRTL